jgi:hypothetical protein
MGVIHDLVKNFVRENWDSNRFVKKILLEQPEYWSENTDIEIVQGIYDALVYGAGLEDEKMKRFFTQYRSDIVIYFEDFIDRAGYDDFFVADAETPLYRFIMATVLDDLAYCLGWYIVEQLEQEVFPELQEANCLKCALSMLIRILQKQEKTELN